MPSPTDPVAASSIAVRVPLPRHMMHILKGKSLHAEMVCMPRSNQMRNPTSARRPRRRTRLASAHVA